MMIRRSRQLCPILVCAFAVSGLIAVPARAHHSGADYDTSKQVQLVGAVKEFRWANPHVWVNVTASDDAGSARDWHIEAGSLGMMARTGWTRTAIKAGDMVTITVNPLRSGEPGGALVKVVLPDGRVLGGGVATPALPLKP